MTSLCTLFITAFVVISTYLILRGSDGIWRDVQHHRKNSLRNATGLNISSLRVNSIETESDFSNEGKNEPSA
ncbi:MAG: hypothetical protein AAF562_10090 [Pseudomonadota bacterium]